MSNSLNGVLRDMILNAQDVSRKNFDILKDANIEHGDGTWYCAARDNYEALRRHGINLLSAYEHYVWANATENAAYEILTELARIESGDKS